MAANTELTQQEIKKNIEQATRSLEEEKHLFEALLEHLLTGVILTNSEGHLLLYNQQAQQLLEEINGTKPGLGRDILKIFESNPVPGTDFFEFSCQTSCSLVFRETILSNFDNFESLQLDRFILTE